VLPVLLFAAFWAVLGLGVFFLAVRGGPGGVRETVRRQTRGGRRISTLTFAVVYIGFGVALPVGFLTGNHANANSQVGGLRLTAAEKQGRQSFGQHCGVCHTLAAANAVGKVGPNLDQIRPSESLVLHTIINGCVQSPPTPSSSQTCLGEGTMPANVVQGKDAQDVAAFVARVAGQE
jgi:mono/diheme cytochrome c family protein